MKTILVDAVNAFVSVDGEIDTEMHKLLESYPQNKIVLTGANEEQQEKFRLGEVPYELFTLSHDPEKTDPEYYKIVLKHFGLEADDVVYFEHNLEAVESAKSVGITTHHYDPEKRDLGVLKDFLDRYCDSE